MPVRSCSRKVRRETLSGKRRPRARSDRAVADRLCLGLPFPSCLSTHTHHKDCGKVSKAGMEKGVWDAVHVVEALPKGKDQAEYKLTSTVMLSATKKDLFKLEGNLTRQMERTLPTKQGHVPNIGMVVEELEGGMRNSLQQVYFGWCEQVVSSIRNSGMKLPEKVIEDLKAKAKV